MTSDFNLPDPSWTSNWKWDPTFQINYEWKSSIDPSEKWVNGFHGNTNWYTPPNKFSKFRECVTRNEAWKCITSCATSVENTLADIDFLLTKIHKDDFIRFLRETCKMGHQTGFQYIVSATEEYVSTMLTAEKFPYYLNEAWISYFLKFKINITNISSSGMDIKTFQFELNRPFFIEIGDITCNMRFDESMLEFSPKQFPYIIERAHEHFSKGHSN